MKDFIISDTQAITHAGMQALILNTNKASAVLYAGSKSELIKTLISYPAAVVILDYALSDFSSVDELLNTGDRFPESNWLLFSDELSSDFLRRVFLGNKLYSVVLKSCELDEINTALFSVIRNERFICNRVVNQLLQHQKSAKDGLEHILTATEKEVLKEIAFGKTTKEIAFSRNLSFHTVITHRKNIFRKLEVNNVHEAIKYAMRAGLVDLAEYYI